jgi:hypothetical protein
VLRVKPVPGEATRFWVESNTLQCVVPECAKQFNRKLRSDLGIGSLCPSCKAGKLDVRFHTVDLANYEPVGECSCEHFQFRLGPELSKMPPEQRAEKAALMRCSHIREARDFAIDLTLKAHEKHHNGKQK